MFILRTEIVSHELIAKKWEFQKLLTVKSRENQFFVNISQIIYFSSIYAIIKLRATFTSGHVPRGPHIYNMFLFSVLIDNLVEL